MSSVGTLFVLLSFVVFVGGDLVCDIGWTMYYKEETCVYHYPGAMPWDAARLVCKAYGGWLIRIGDADKQKFFTAVHRDKHEQVWLGLKRTKKGAKDVTWIGDTSPATYTNWASREPRYYSSGRDCVSTTGSSGLWELASCDTAHEIVCEKLATHTAPKRCPKGWAMHGKNCFMIYDVKQTWNKARTVCRYGSADLATIPDAETLDFIKKKLATKGRDLWIGLSNTDKGGAYNWIIGNRRLGFYDNWASGQPGDRSPACVYLGKGTGYKWTGDKCEANHSPLCQRPALKDDIVCPYGWDLNIQEKKCQLSWYPRYSWKEARTFCKDIGADLVKITDEAKENYVRSRLSRLSDQYWIGLHKNAGSEKLTWLDEVQKASYNKADLNTWRRDTEYCGYIRKNDTVWGRDKCTQKGPTICEMNAYAYINCPKDYTVNKRGRTCLKLSTDSLEWEKAREACQKDGSDLVKVSSYDENVYIQDMAKKLKTPVWIGLHDRQKDNHFQWLDDSKDVSSKKLYVNWGSNQPDDTDGLSNCVQLDYAKGQWFDNGCSTKNRYVCQHKATIMREPIKLDTRHRQCPKGWSKYESTTCIKYNTDKKTWKQARKTCQQTGGDLIKITTNDFAKFVNILLKNSKAKVEPYIGLSDLAKTGTYAWLDDQKKTTFDNWNGAGQPSGAKDHCALIVVDQKYEWEWNDVTCDSLKGYICQQKALLSGSINCGEGWEDSPFSDYCYKYNKDSLNWYDAQNSCEINGGNLVSAVTQEEMLYLAGRSQSEDGDSFWSGGTDMYMGSRWQWTDGQPFAYFNWEFGEPTNNQSDNCVAFNKESGRWRVAACIDHMPSICKKLGFVINHPTPPPVVAPTNIPSDQVWACPPTWTEYRDSCYALYVTNNEGLTWGEADKHCQTESAHLVSIRDDRESAFVLTVLPRRHSAWIGLSDVKRRYNFAWSDNLTPMTYTNWKDDEPDFNGNKKLCVGMWKGSGKWFSDDCNNPRLYHMCKRQKSLRDRSKYDPYKGCKQGGKGYLNKCYRFYSVASKKFDNAQAACKALGGNLATLNDRYTQAFVSAEMPKTNFWIGLSNTKATVDAYGKTQYLYSWTSGEKFKFAHWDRDHLGREIKTCVAIMSSKPPGLWHNYPCGRSLPFVCEYPRPGYTTPKPITTTTTLLPCPGDWVAIGHMCYKGIFEEKQSWMGANSYCQSMVIEGGSLASMTSKGLEKTIMSVVVPSDKRASLWIGLNDRDVESGYTWVGGEPFVYQNWKDNEPNNKHNIEDCVKWDLNSNKWEDSNCYGALTFICQAPRGLQQRTTLPPPTIGSTVSQCGNDLRVTWTMYNGYCYMVNQLSWRPIQVDWYEAKSNCRKVGAELASITDSKENGYITTLLGRSPVNRAWIGLNNFDGDIYKWVDGTPVTFLAWKPNEPNDGNGGQRCVMLDSDGLWSDMRCGGDSFTFVCKKRPGSFSPITVPSTTVPTGGCPLGFYGMQGTSRCYRVIGADKFDRKSFVDSIQACKDIHKNSRMASIHSDIDQEFVTTLIADLDVPVWIGLNAPGIYSYNYAKYFWIDNSDVNYVHWGADGLHTTNKRVKRCVELMITPNTAGDWKGVTCLDKLPFVCEYSKSSLFRTEPPNIKDCPEGYTRYIDSCYKYVPTLQNWTMSEQTCVQDGSRLANEQGGFDMAYIDLMIQTRGQEKLWIGLSEDVTKNAFTWSDGWPVWFTSWGDGQPDLSKKCVAQSRGGKWRTADCQLQLPSVCQFRVNAASMVSPKVPGKCPSKIWKQFGENCYFIETSNVRSWPEALYQCTSRNGQLVSIHNEADFKIVNFLVDLERVDAWIGLQRPNQDASFTWSDKTEVEYFNWAPGSPSTTNTDTQSTNCVLSQGINGQWSDTKCDDKHAYICKVKQIPISTTSAPSTTSTTTPTTTTATTPTKTTTTATTSTTPTTTTTIVKVDTLKTTRAPSQCDPDLCLHGSCKVITSSFGSYFLCSCQQGWTGKNCDQVLPVTHLPVNPSHSKQKSDDSSVLPVTHLPVNPSHSKQNSDDSSGVGTPGVVGIVLGVMIGIAGIVIGVFIFVRRQKQNSSTPATGFDNRNYVGNEGSIELKPAHPAPSDEIY